MNMAGSNGLINLQNQDLCVVLEELTLYEFVHYGIIQLHNVLLFQSLGPCWLFN